MTSRCLTAPLALILGVCLAGTACTFAQSAPTGAPPTPPTSQQLLQLQWQMAQQRVAEAAAIVDDLESKKESIVDELDDLNISDASFVEVMSTLQTQRIQLMIDLRGLKARQQAVEDLVRQMNAREENQMLIEMLERSVANAESSLEQLQRLHKAGSIPSSQLYPAEQAVLEARIRLTQARQEASTQQSSEVANITIDRAEKMARLEMVEQLLKDFVASREKVEQAQRMDIRITEARMTLFARENELREVEHRMLVEEKKDSADDRQIP